MISDNSDNNRGAIVALFILISGGIWFFKYGHTDAIPRSK